jgi:tRNA 2-thiouridine synthesizing protein B
MMTLHTLNASPASAAFADCLRLVAPGDALLLLGDGVYAALAGTGPCRALDASGAELYVLAHICSAAVVDIDGFVALSERFARQLAWY